MSKNQFLPEKVRRPRTEMLDAVNLIEKLYKGEEALVVCGSWRREKDTIGDMDILVPPATDFRTCVATFHQLGYEPARSGDVKSEGVIDYRGKPLLLNLWKVPGPRAWAAMLLFATGPNDMNIMMRAAAKGKGWKLGQYGLFDDEDHQRDKGDSEEQIFALLGFPYLTPKEREYWRDKKLGDYASSTVPVRSSDGVTVYHVTMKDGKAVMCECVGFGYRSHCRHLAEAERKVARSGDVG